MVIYILDFTLDPINALGHLAQAFLVISLPLSALWASHQSEQSPIPRTSLSNVTEHSSQIAQKFRFLRRSKEGSHDDLEKSSSFTDTTTTSVKQGKGAIETAEDVWRRWARAAGGLEKVEDGCEFRSFWEHY